MTPITLVDHADISAVIISDSVFNIYGPILFKIVNYDSLNKDNIPLLFSLNLRFKMLLLLQITNSNVKCQMATKDWSYITNNEQDKTSLQRKGIY